MTHLKILIENDILIQLEKQLKAEKLGYRLDCFFSVNEFLSSAKSYHEETPIYLGSHLGGEVAQLNFKLIYPLEELDE